MKTVTREQFKTDIVKFFEKESGLTINAAIKKIKSEMVIDKWGNTNKDRVKAGNVTLFFTNNSNYCGGLKKGYGKGFYISNNGFTGGSTIKLN